MAVFRVLGCGDVWVLGCLGVGMLALLANGSIYIHVPQYVLIFRCDGWMTTACLSMSIMFRPGTREYTFFHHVEITPLLVLSDYRRPQAPIFSA